MTFSLIAERRRHGRAAPTAARPAPAGRDSARRPADPRQGHGHAAEPVSGCASKRPGGGGFRRAPRRREFAQLGSSRPKKNARFAGDLGFPPGFRIFKELGRPVSAGGTQGIYQDVPPQSPPVSSHANCFQRMGCHRPRPRGRRAAADAPQGRPARARQAVPARPRALLPVSHVRQPDAATSCASPTSPSCAARSRRASGATASRRCTRSPPASRSSSPTACASAPGPKSPDTSRSPTRAASTRCRRSTCGRRATPKAPGLAPPAAAARAAAAHLPHPAAGDGQGQGRVQRLPDLGRAAARTALRGHAGAVRRRVRARLRRDRGDHRAKPAGRRSSSEADAARSMRSLSAASTPAVASASRAASAPDSGTRTSRGPIIGA